MKGKNETPEASHRVEGDFRKVAVRGGAWMIAQVIASKALTMLSTLLLLQLLTPQDFATATLATSAQALALILPPITIGDVLVANGHRFRRFRNIAMWSGAIATAGVTIGLAVAGPYLAESYGDPALRLACLWIGLRPVGELLAMGPTSILRLQLRFKALAAVESGTTVVAVALSVTMAFLGFGFMSIILPPAIAAIARAGMYAILTAGSAEFPGARGPTDQDTATSSSLVGQIVVACLAQYVHGTFFFCVPLLLGKFVDKQEVGWYWSAFTLATSLNAVVSFAMGNLLQPIFSKMSHDRLRQSEAFLSACRAVSAVAMPLCFLQAVLAAPLFAILPERWQGALHATELMCIGQAFFFPVNPAMALLKSRAEFGRYFVWQSAQLIAVAGGMLAAAQVRPDAPFMPMLAVASLANVFFAPIGVVMCSGGPRRGAKAIAAVFAKPLLVSIVGLGPIWALAAARPAGTAWSVAALLMLPPLGILSCTISLAMIDPSQFQSLARDLRNLKDRSAIRRQ